MRLKKKPLKNCYLYVITKADAAKAKKIAEAGADIIQLRDKKTSDKKLLEAAVKIASVCRKNKVLFIINDRLDIALACQADGVHLGQDDLGIKTARKLVPKNFLIGLSTHSLEQAQKAQKEGADYIGFGPIFATGTKPHLKPIGENKIIPLSKKIKIPYFIIGNINQKNLSGLKTKGVKRVAVHSAVYKSKNPQREILLFKRQLV